MAVPNLGEGINQHMAMLIQNKKGKWEYFSINGDNVYVSGKFSGGRKFNDISVGSFDSPQQFMDSEYNESGDKDDKSINSYGFKEAYVIPTTTSQDEKIRDAFIDNSNNEYNLLGNNCSTVVQLSLEAGGIKTYTKTKNTYSIPSNYKLGESSFTVSISNSRPIIPSVSFRNIIKPNPNGKLISTDKK